MLISKFIYFLIIVPIFSIVFYVVMRFQTFKNKNEEWRKENLNNIVLGATLAFALLTYFSVKTVYLVKDNGSKTYTVIGPLNYKFQNGEKVRIKKETNTIVINDSNQYLTLESVDYGFSSILYGGKYKSIIKPYTYFSSAEEIDYKFEYDSPPEKIEVQGRSGAERRYWLHK